eukprot:4482406-Pyramimonas_sp.AAC.1
MYPAVELHADIKPLSSHSATGEFDSPPEYVHTLRKCPSRELSVKLLSSHFTAGEFDSPPEYLRTPYIRSCRPLPGPVRGGWVVRCSHPNSSWNQSQGTREHIPRVESNRRGLESGFLFLPRLEPLELLGPAAIRNRRGLTREHILGVGTNHMGLPREHIPGVGTNHRGLASIFQ